MINKELNSGIPQTIVFFRNFETFEYDIKDIYVFFNIKKSLLDNFKKKSNNFLLKRI